MNIKVDINRLKDICERLERLDRSLDHKPLRDRNEDEWREFVQELDSIHTALGVTSDRDD